MLRIHDRKSRFYGFRVLATWLPENPDCYMVINMDKKLIYINKSAREGARVVRLIQ